MAIHADSTPPAIDAIIVVDYGLPKFVGVHIGLGFNQHNSRYFSHLRSPYKVD